MCGHVTSSYASVCLGHPIALALLSGGRSRHGETLFAAASDGSIVPVVVGSPIASVSKVNSAATGVLTYDDLITLWAKFDSFEMNTMICHVDNMKNILTLAEFKDPLAGFKFQNTGEVFSPLGAKLVRSDETPTDLIVGIDSRFAVEQVITQPLTVEFDKVIEQRFEEAVISESVTFARVIQEAAVALDTNF